MAEEVLIVALISVPLHPQVLLQVVVNRLRSIVREDCGGLHDLVYEVYCFIVRSDLLPLSLDDVGQFGLPVFGRLVRFFKVFSIELTISLLFSDWGKVHSFVGKSPSHIKWVELTRVQTFSIKFLGGW